MSSRRRDTHKATIVKITKKVKEFSDTTSLPELNLNEESLTAAWQAFRDEHFEIVDKTGDELIEFENIEFDSAEDLYMAAKLTLMSLLAKYMQNDSDDDDTVNQRNTGPTGGGRPYGDTLTIIKKKSLRLKPMDLPEFDGSYALWPSFRDLFVSLIHNNDDLSKVQRLYYLKQALTNQAEDLISDIELTDANYDTAWQNVQDRYNNEYLLVIALLDKVFKVPPMKQNDPNSARKLLDSTTQTILSLSNMARPTEHWDDILVYVTITKLDALSKEKWNEETANLTEMPKWKQMQDFLRKRYRSYDTAMTSTPVAAAPPTERSTNKPTATSQSKKSFHVNESCASTVSSGTTPKATRIVKKCPACSSDRKDHRLRLCPKFKSQSSQQRKSCVESNRLCYNCFSDNHLVSSCNSVYNCLKCQGKHHTMLHVETEIPAVVKSNLVVGITNSATLFKHVVLATALVDVKDRNGIWYRFRALLDQGSQASFITERASQLLNLSRRNTDTMFESVGNHQIHQPNGLIDVEFMSARRSPAMLPTFSVEVYVLPNVTSLLPSNRIEMQNWAHLANLQLADPTFFEPSQVDMLLGGDIYPDVIMEGLIKTEVNGLIAQKTALGWIVMGHLRLPNEPTTVRAVNVCRIECKHLQRFWKLEEISAQKPLSEEDARCEEHYRRTHHRNEDGRYVVRHQFKKSFGESLHLGKSRNLALSSQYRLERRFAKDPNLHRDYVKFMDELLSSNYLEEIPKDELDCDPEKSFYLPHHPVIRESSSTTKLRVVFNASIKSSNGVSLNDTMLIGPSLQNNLFDILVHVRQFPIAFASDVEKMYKRILVDRRDRDYQRIVWRAKPTDPMKEYRLLILTDGFNSAPFLALRTIRQLADDECHRFPLAQSIAKRDVYMDDVFSGAYTVESALEKQRQLIGMFNAGSFWLRKWSSNAKELMNSVPTEERDVTFGQDLAVKTLGIYWNPATDTFGFEIRLPESQSTPTKRGLISESSRLFDPLGWLAPPIIIAKILYQRLWVREISWDEPLPAEILDDWNEFRGTLRCLEDIKIERWLGNSVSHNLIEIHGFSDASLMAYSAVIYMRTELEDGTVRTSQICAKSKVAPVNTVSLPNLELCGALLLARLLEKVQNALILETHVRITAWTDSMLVLWWLQSTPSRWKTFVANRTSEILRLIPADQWRHVPTDDNPADCVTKGVSPRDLQSHPLWWNGPNWLKLSSDVWPHTAVVEPINVDIQERKVRKLIAAISTSNSDVEIINRFSSLRRLIRFTARVKRMAANARLPANERNHSFLSVPELKNALEFLLKSTQARHFVEEISALASNDDLRCKSKLLPLSPYLDSRGLLRVGGRLKNSNLNYQQKFPIILPEKDHLTQLIISEAHTVKTMHGHIQLMLNVIRQNYWILGGRKLIKRCIDKCCVCYRYRAKAKTQLMAHLPTPRVIPSRPFSHCAVDYAGPIKLQLYKGGRCRTSVNGYIAVFVCMATRAIHLEPVSEATTEAFHAAVKRLMGIHGFVEHFYSDNGTQFKGSKTELERLMWIAIKEAEDYIAPLLANDNIQWHFNPPSAPHFGGIFEAGVKSMKYHLKRILGNSSFTYEELSTFLYQTAGVLNSRPISALNDDINDFNALTPGHFLMLSAPIVMPEPTLLDVQENRLNRWQRVQQAFQHMWQRWSEEYLHTLQQRNKWRKAQANVSVGELVLVVENNLPPSKWLMGRIIETYPDADGFVRSVKLQLQKGTLVRPIVKICPLPLGKDVEETSSATEEEASTNAVDDVAPGADSSSDNQSRPQRS